MKALKLNYLGKTNLIFTIVAILSYLTIYWGWIAHIGLGIFQVLLALFLVIKRRAILGHIKIHFWVYALLVLSTLLSLFFGFENLRVAAWALSFIIAFYFSWIMYQLKEVRDEN